RGINPFRSTCHTEGAAPADTRRCISPSYKAGYPYDILVWGDSLGDALFPGIAELAERYGLSARQATKSACAPVLGVRPSQLRKQNCAEYNEEMLRELQFGPRPSLAILVSRWSLVVGVLPQGLIKTIDSLNELGIATLLIGQAPEFPFDPNACVVRRAMAHRNVNECLSQP